MSVRTSNCARCQRSMQIMSLIFSAVPVPDILTQTAASFGSERAQNRCCLDRNPFRSSAFWVYLRSFNSLSDHSPQRLRNIVTASSAKPALCMGQKAPQHTTRSTLKEGGHMRPPPLQPQLTSNQPTPCARQFYEDLLLHPLMAPPPPLSNLRRASPCLTTPWCRVWLY